MHGLREVVDEVVVDVRRGEAERMVVMMTAFGSSNSDERRRTTVNDGDRADRSRLSSVMGKSCDHEMMSRRLGRTWNMLWTP